MLASCAASSLTPSPASTARTILTACSRPFAKAERSREGLHSVACDLSHVPYLLSVPLLDALEGGGELPRRLRAGGF